MESNHHIQIQSLPRYRYDKGLYLLLHLPKDYAIILNAIISLVCFVYGGELALCFLPHFYIYLNFPYALQYVILSIVLSVHIHKAHILRLCKITYLQSFYIVIPFIRRFCIYVKSHISKTNRIENFS